MKFTLKTKIVIETDKYNGFCSIDRVDGKEEISLNKIKEEINRGHYLLEWINSDLSYEQEPTIIIKI